MIVSIALFATPAFGAESHILYDKSGVDVIASDASQTVSYIKEGASKDQLCAGTGSDFAAYSNKGFSFGGKENVGLTDDHGVAGFGGRTAMVLITREMMFRACELSLNTNSNRAESIEIYKLFLDAVTRIAQDSQPNGTSASSASIGSGGQATPDSNDEEADTDDDDA
jgi:hypothetical protein